MRYWEFNEELIKKNDHDNRGWILEHKQVEVAPPLVKDLDQSLTKALAYGVRTR